MGLFFVSCISAPLPRRDSNKQIQGCSALPLSAEKQQRDAAYESEDDEIERRRDDRHGRHARAAAGDRHPFGHVRELATPIGVEAWETREDGKNKEGNAEPCSQHFHEESVEARTARS